MSTINLGQDPDEPNDSFYKFINNGWCLGLSAFFGVLGGIFESCVLGGISFFIFFLFVLFYDIPE